MMTPVPPWELVHAIGGGDFELIGEMFLRHFIDFGDLKPTERVLDVGCGVGRMAVPLTKYLGDGGSYEGFDVFVEGVTWCRQNITPEYPTFRFQVANIYNGKYNPKGKYTASEYRFPYESGSFDFVFLTSVFTHMLPCDMENYLSEVARVLSQEGRCLITFFLLNAESLALIRAKSSALDFRYDAGGCLTTDKDTPEAAVAYDERVIGALFAKHGLKIKDPVHYGSWCGRQKHVDWQDIVVAVKEKGMALSDEEGGLLSMWTSARASSTIQDLAPNAGSKTEVGSTTTSLPPPPPTPFWKLPLKAWSTYRRGGITLLRQEARYYLRWWRGRLLP